MLSYRDATFCSFYEKCEFHNAEYCSRALTEEVQKAADEFGLPICQWAEPPDCYEEADDEQASRSGDNLPLLQKSIHDQSL